MKKLKYKAGDMVMMDSHLYCEILSYADGWAVFQVINGAWIGNLSDAGVMIIDPNGGNRRIRFNQYVSYVFLPGEDAGNYNEVIEAYENRRWSYSVERRIKYAYRLFKEATRDYRIKLATWIDPRPPREKFMDSDISF